MQSNLLLPSLPGLLCRGMVAPHRVVFMGLKECLIFKLSSCKTKLFKIDLLLHLNCVLMVN